MSHRFRSTLLVLPLLTLAMLNPQARAAAPQLAAPKALDAAADPRLAQNVSLSTRSATLKEALAGLGEKAGVRLEAAREVAELKVTLLGKELPLGRTLAEVGELLDLTWSRKGSAPAYRYECARSQEATLRARAALQESRSGNRAAAVAQIARIAQAVSRGEIASLAVSDPEVAATLQDPVRGERTRELFKFLGEMSPEKRDEFFRNGQVSTSYDQMPPAIRSSIRRQTEPVLPLVLGSIQGPDGNSPGYESVMRSARFTMGIGGLEYGGNSVYGEMNVGGLPLRISVDLGVPPPASEAAPGAGANTPAAVPGTVVMSGGTSGGARRPLPPVTAKLEARERLSVREIVDWLAEKLPVAVVSDFYVTRYERRTVSLPPAATVEAALEALNRQAGLEYTVSADDRVLRLRNRRWPLLDQMEPPPAMVEALNQALRKQGRLGLADYLLAARLTEAQAGGLAQMEEQRFGALGRALDGSRPLLNGALRLTATLSPAQRAAAESPAGLALAALAPPQQALLAGALGTGRADLRPQQLAGTRFRFRRHEQPVSAVPALAILPLTVESYLYSVQVPGRPPMPAVLVLGPSSTRPAAQR